MFEIEIFSEILRTLSRNKLRTFLTGVSVAWGIFILVVLLGSGKGLDNGFRYAFGNTANCIRLGGWQTSIPYKGLRPGRSIQLVNADCDLLRQVSGVEYVCPLQGSGGTFTRGDREENYRITMVGENFARIANITLLEGRFVNQGDVEERRKVAILGQKIVEFLFKGKSPVGDLVKINGIPFEVIGVFTEEQRTDQYKDREAYIPISTGQRIFIRSDVVRNIWACVGNAGVEESKAILNEIKKKIAGKYRFDPKDSRALWTRNNTEDFQSNMEALRGINIFIWLVGVCTMIAGAVGVSNIMMIAVDERTKEIGVRKALGATPSSIMGMIVLESLMITLAFGMLGMACGVGALDVATSYLPPIDFFRSPEADITTAALAVVALACAGVAASIVPARKAIKIRPIEALRDE